MKRKKIIKVSLIVTGILIAIAGGVIYYMFNMPHRDVQATKTDYTFSSSFIVEDYLKDEDAANNKYLDSEGESKVLEITGPIKEITEDFEGNQVILLQTETDKAGVSCTFTKETNAHAKKQAVGKTVTIKGVIRSGASFDIDLDMYENVIVDKCDIITNK